MKYILSLITAWLLLSQSAFAGNYAYIYIEGDKQTPFYVKLEGQMMPRLGKNYCILSNLASGVSYIEILFQQNAYPSQKFALNIPDGGSRGFVLQKVNDRQFALYDIQQGNYIVSGNKPEEDHAPEPQQPVVTNAGTDNAATSNTVAASSSEELPAFKPVKKPKGKKATETTETAEPSQSSAAENKKEDGRFINDIELNNGGAAAAEPLPEFNAPKPVPVRTKKGKKKPVTQEETSLAAINDEDGEKDIAAGAAKEEEKTAEAGMPNTDCKTPMSSEVFEDFALKILDKSDDNARLKVLSKNKGRLCFTTEQVRIIANNLDTQSGRYEVVKMLYAQTSDQGNYPQLEALFKTNYLKEKFRQIINPK